MKKFSISIVVCLFLANPIVFAYNSADLKKLRETCSCVGCDLSDANLSNFKLGDEKTLIPSKATSKNGVIICDISGANFKGANLKNAYFSITDFAPGINNKVTKIIMENTHFQKANLSGAHFNAVNADNSNFSYANMSNAKIMKASSFRACNFKYVNMQEVHVSPPMGGCGAYFNNSDFSFANLQNSKLIADFTGVNFSNANLTSAQLIPCK